MIATRIARAVRITSGGALELELAESISELLPEEP